ncbi:MAG TPA: HU family DNA-binding protein [Nitrospirae bacterium]|nr:DNA-binding protein HU 1 [bacterium BMS3Abin09]GBE40308.1 DNA-binding protein HU 1 [bacterium BMS3Bbin09]HDH34830.1 HU family DNA-binding protein [Nitrospirota bacterium]HDN94680.1 HU family DNA-binding protein [Nitrospirota bacterium]HDZ83839.1 HU family DNA-binding protein [Nitrospirota bacterium]
MSKGDLIESVAKSAALSKAKATVVVNAVLDSISKSLKKGKSVTLVGFGSFSVVKRKARNGRNPQTGATIKIKATKAPKFKAGKGLKDAVAGKK